MKMFDKQFFQSLLIVLLSLVAFLLVIAGWVKIEEYKKLFYKVDTKFEDTDIVQLTNKLPISDEIGKNYNGSGMEKGIAEYKEFTISNPNEKKVKYEIYLTKIDTDSEIKSNYIKLYLTDDNNNPMKGFEKNKITSFYDLYALSNKPGSRLLYRGSLVSGSSQKLILRSWISDAYVLSNTEEKFSFDVDVRIK